MNQTEQLLEVGKAFIDALNKSSFSSVLNVSRNSYFLIIFRMEDKKKGTISFDELAKIDRHQQPMFIEEIRRDENGKVKAYVLKRNPNYKKKL